MDFSVCNFDKRGASSTKWYFPVNPGVYAFLQLLFVDESVPKGIEKGIDLWL
jgi:hypothetical protein